MRAFPLRRIHEYGAGSAVPRRTGRALRAVCTRARRPLAVGHATTTLVPVHCPVAKDGHTKAWRSAPRGERAPRRARGPRAATPPRGVVAAASASSVMDSWTWLLLVLVWSSACLLQAAAAPSVAARSRPTFSCSTFRRSWISYMMQN
jgi:hypothetical protein